MRKMCSLSLLNLSRLSLNQQRAHLTSEIFRIARGGRGERGQTPLMSNETGHLQNARIEEAEDWEEHDDAADYKAETRSSNSQICKVPRTRSLPNRFPSELSYYQKTRLRLDRLRQRAGDFSRTRSGNAPREDRDETWLGIG